MLCPYHTNTHIERVSHVKKSRFGIIEHNARQSCGVVVEERCICAHMIPVYPKGVHAYDV